MAAAARKSAADRIESAQAQLEQANREIAELTERRNQCLLKDDDTVAAIDLGIKIANLKNAARAHEDRIQLLRKEAAEEEQARKAKEKAVLIERVEKLFAQRDAAAAELATAVKQSDAAFRKMLDIGQAIITAWPWAPPDMHATFTPLSVVTATMHELYKIGARPRRFGGMDKSGVDGLDFPGGRCPDLRLANLQEQIKPLTAVCAEASALASSITHTGKSSSHVEPAVMAAAVLTYGQSEPPQRTEAEVKLAQLLRRQSELAEDPWRSDVRA
jgi:hypothetical protein